MRLDHADVIVIRWGASGNEGDEPGATERPAPPLEDTVMRQSITTHHQLHSLVTRGRGLGLLALLGLPAAGCDPGDSADVERDSALIVELGEDDDAVDPAGDAGDVLGTVELPSGGSIAFVSAGDDSIAVVVSATPESAPLVDYLMEHYDPTPLELFRYFAPEQAAPALLVTNHAAELAAKGLDAAEPRALAVPRVALPNSGVVGSYDRCHVQAQWSSDWSSSFAHRDVQAAATFNNTQLVTAAKFYSGADDVQRVNWGVCQESYYANQVEYVSFSLYKSNEPFNWDCGGGDWTLVTLPTAVAESTASVIYYYAGATPDKTCIRVWAPTFGVGDELYRSFGAAVAYDEPLVVG